ncbi:MAG: hypothetical protein JWN56_2788 [Sphingobacteriales bacterium]|nr:hypothetical protein [Sphingobacteriales bacterium]
MKKFIFLVFAYLLSNLCAAQTPKQVQLVSSQLLRGVQGTNLIRVIKPVFSHEGSTLSADSANFQQEKNTFDAFGNVVITQPNGTTIFGDVLNYNGNTKVAVLTNNVRFIDGDATLTTNFLTYNMGTKIGNYTGGGKIVNGANVLTSKNGYYFSNSRDAYFRYDVVVNSPDAIIKSDTLRYNTTSKISYFYGPTKIFNKSDKSTLYTENGTYNTTNEQARFGKKNLYTAGSKSLKGDSLFYDGKLGIGRAIKNITFTDTASKMIFRGDIGLYRAADSSILATKNAYVILTTKDSSKVDSIYMVADTLFSKIVFTRDISIYQKDELVSDTALSDPSKVTASDGNNPENLVADSDEGKESLTTGKSKREKSNDDKSVLGNSSTKEETNKKSKKAKSGLIKSKKTGITYSSDSLSMIKSIDSVKTKEDSLKYVRRQTDSVAEPMKDSLKIAIVGQGKPAGTNNKAKGITSAADSVKKVKQVQSAKPDVKGVVKETVDKKPAGIKAAKDSISLDTSQIAIKRRQDSITRMSDTTKTRIVMAYHHAKIFKIDLQAKADSMFFSYKDSTIRCYINPIIWAQGSQLTSDTTYLQLRNGKLDNMLLQHNAMIVNTEGDSTKFNQVKGKVITGYFVENKLDRMFVDGNAESLYYTKEDSTYSGMNHMISSRIKVLFRNSELEDIISIRKPEGTYYPIDKIPKDEAILEGFLWKPKERPRSKEEIIPTFAKADKKLTTAPKKASKAAVVKPVNKPNATKTQKPATSPPVNKPIVKAKDENVKEE